MSLNFNLNDNNPSINYKTFSSTFRYIIDKHAPIKQRLRRGNQAPFMNKELRKAIYTRSHLKNKLNKNATPENRHTILNSKEINVLVSGKKLLKLILKQSQHKAYLVKSFITNKGGLQSSDIMLIENDNISTNEKELTTLLNNHYINIIEKRQVVNQPVYNLSVVLKIPKQ